MFNTILIPLLLRYGVAILSAGLGALGIFAPEQVDVLTQQVQIIVGAVGVVVPILLAAIGKLRHAPGEKLIKQIRATPGATGAVIIKTAEGEPDKAVTVDRSALR